MIRFGTHRIVLLLGPVVMKFPRINLPIGFITDVISLIQARIPLRQAMGWAWGSLMHHVFHQVGLGENWNEAVRYWRIRHRILVPCVIPLIIVNVYLRKRGVGNFTFDTCGDFVARAAPEDRKGLLGISCRKGHWFDDRDNFAFDRQRVWILDYGDRHIDMMQLLKCHGDQLEQLLRSFAIEEKG
ncbi:MAG: hypothetical protein ABIG71_04150 [Candidatus Uhrbacteria bacterium]